MDMTSTWRAVLLIDEADVFLERRSLHDIHRNAMVSVFLRVLEYYSGILFLTTNRVTTFDDAFKSRIHIPIRYTDLTVDSRRQIWRNFCRLVPGGVDIDEKGLSTLADTDLNGRQAGPFTSFQVSDSYLNCSSRVQPFECPRHSRDCCSQYHCVRMLFSASLFNLCAFLSACSHWFALDAF